MSTVRIIKVAVIIILNYSQVRIKIGVKMSDKVRVRLG
jgi:hypothetical protein